MNNISNQATYTNAVYTTTGTGYLGINTGGGAGIPSFGGIYGGVPAFPSLNTPPPATALPATGHRISYTLVDANGVHHYLTIDATHVPVIDALNAFNRSQQRPLSYPQSQTPIMTEGEFSLDELDKAEEIMSEMACE